MGNQIELIKKLYAKSRVYTIPKEPKEGMEQVQVTITALSLEDLSVLNMSEDLPMSELAKNAKILFARSLQIKEEEAAQISVEFMEELLGAVMETNNFDEKDMKKTGIKDFIDKKREQIAEAEKKEVKQN
jgi:hypothetical protein